MKNLRPPYSVDALRDSKLVLAAKMSGKHTVLQCRLSTMHLVPFPGISPDNMHVSCELHRYTQGDVVASCKSLFNDVLSTTRRLIQARRSSGGFFAKLPCLLSRKLATLRANYCTLYSWELGHTALCQKIDSRHNLTRLTNVT